MSCPKKGGDETRKLRYVPGFATALYLIMYSAGRFVIEFFRDDYRGWVGALSTSQFISIFILAGGVVLLVAVLKGKGTKETGN